MSISEIKAVHDFAGNAYTLVELNPMGYMLFHDASGVFVEYSTRTASPYLGLEDGLYYAGIKEYYRAELSAGRTLSRIIEYKHTVIDQSVSEEEVAAYEEASDSLNDALLAGKNENIVNYIQNDTPLQVDNRALPQEIQETASGGSQKTATYNGLTVVKDYTFFTGLKDCGYIDGGKCGYIAAAILMAYRQRSFGESYMPASYITYGVNMQVTPNAAGPQVTVATEAAGFNYMLFNSTTQTVVSQGYFNGSRNIWNFALRSLPAGQYTFQAGANGGRHETTTFTVGTASNITRLKVVPNPSGPHITVTTGGAGFNYMLFNSTTQTVVRQGSISGSSNVWNYALLSLERGQYTFQAGVTGGKHETITFSVGNTALSTSLATELYNTGVSIGYGAGTISRSIRFTVNKYLSNNGYLSVSYIDDIIPLANAPRIADCIDIDRPVIWFGEVFNNTYNNQTWIEHAVVTYGYSSSWGTYSFIAHFGWPNATEVYFNGVLASMYTCWR